MKSTTPQIRIITFIVFITLILVTTSAFSIANNDLTKISSTQTLEKIEKITLHDAIAKKLISAKFRGTGAAFGDAITVEVKNKTKFPLTIEVIPGNKIISNDTSKQNMVLGKVKGELVDETNYLINDFIEIQPKSKDKFVLEAYCIDIDRENPTTSTCFQIGDLDSSIQFLIQHGKNMDFSLHAIQAAIWIFLENKTDEQLKERIEINNEDLQNAKELIKNL